MALQARARGLLEGNVVTRAGPPYQETCYHLLVSQKPVSPQAPATAKVT